MLFVSSTPVEATDRSDSYASVSTNAPVFCTAEMPRGKLAPCPLFSLLHIVKARCDVIMHFVAVSLRHRTRQLRGGRGKATGDVRLLNCSVKLYADDAKLYSSFYRAMHVVQSAVLLS